MTRFFHIQSGVRSLAATSAIAALLVLAPAGASADPYTGDKPPRVGAADSGRALSTSQQSTGSSSRGGLPVTGSDILPLTVIGFGALGAGALLVRKSRTRQTI